MQPRIDHFEAVRGPSTAPGTSPTDSIRQITIGGVAAYAFTVKPGDVQEWDLAEGNAGANRQPNERAEISYAPAPDSQKATSPYNVKEGMTQTYDVDYWFLPGFPSHVSARHEWAVLTQFHPQPGAKGIPGFSGATFHDGQITFENPNGDGAYFAKMSIKADGTTKHSIRMAVKWSAGRDGYVVIQGRTTGALIGRYDGPTIAPGEFKYIKQGYYRAGGLPLGTVYQTWLDINEGDLTGTVTATTPPAAGATTSTAPAKRNGKPFDAAGDSVQPNDGAAVLIAIRNGLVALKDPRVQPQIDAANKLLGNGPWTP